MNSQSSTAKSSARAALTLLLALSLLAACCLGNTARAQTRKVAAKTTNSTAAAAITTTAAAAAAAAPTPRPLTDDNLEDIESLVSGYGTMARSEFRDWLHTTQPAEPTAAEYQQSFDLITRGALESKLIIVENGDRTYRLSERTAPVLKFFRRTQVRFIVIAAPEPTLQSSPGLCIIVSSGMIAALGNDTDRLNALVAHELAHELTWRRLVRARDARQFTVTQFLELECDAVAAYALLLLGSKPGTFGQAIAAAINTDPAVAGNNQGVGTHPALAARLALNRQLADALRRVPAQPTFNPGVGQLADQRRHRR